MIYIASPYSYNADENLMQKRFDIVEEFIAENNDKILFSPIVYTHEIAKKYGFPREYSYWRDRDRAFIDSSSELWVLLMPGWDRSIGVTDEIEYAQSKGIKVKFIKML